MESNNLRLFITLLYSLMGMEMIAAHAGEVKHPARIIVKKDQILPQMT